MATFTSVHDAHDHSGVPGVGGSTPAFTGCIATRTTDQSVNTATDTSVSFSGTEEADSDGFHDTVTNPERITIPSGKAGKYLLNAYVIWAPNATGWRRVGFGKNGASLAGGTSTENNLGGSDYHQQNVSMVATLAVGDYVTVQVYQQSGATRTLSGTVVPLRFSATRIGS